MILNRSYRSLCHRWPQLGIHSSNKNRGISVLLSEDLNKENRMSNHQKQQHYHQLQQSCQHSTKVVLPPFSGSSRRRRFVSQPAHTNTSLSSSHHHHNQPTLFSLPNLLHPTDFPQLANNAINECNAVRRSIASSLSSYNDNTLVDISSRVQKAKETLHLLDDISNIVCTVIDAAELCRSVHASPQWRRGASDAFGILSEYIGNLNDHEISISRPFSSMTQTCQPSVCSYTSFTSLCMYK